MSSSLWTPECVKSSSNFTLNTSLLNALIEISYSDGDAYEVIPKPCHRKINAIKQWLQKF